MSGSPLVPIGGNTHRRANANYVAVQRHWRMAALLSSLGVGIVDRIERELIAAQFDRAPWIAVIFAAGIAAWFALKNPVQWGAAILLAIAVASCIGLVWRGRPDRAFVRRAGLVMGLVFAAGLSVIWLRSAAVGVEPIPYPSVERLNGYVVERIDQPAQQRFRLVMAVTHGQDRVPRKIRVNVPLDKDRPGLAEGAIVQMRARLMPPAGPILPGGYDFARAAWFDGLAATGAAIGEVEVIKPAQGGFAIRSLQRRLSQHVQDCIDGPGGVLAAAFASGDRGAIDDADRDAMRDAGLTHLLAISGLHVGAVIAAAYWMVLKLLALIPALALRIRLPLVAAAAGACAGIGYTVLTGMQVPTVRSCAAAMLVLIALALGREPLSLRMVAFAALFVMLLWPEAVMGPSFQMSFTAVLAIVALHASKPVKSFLAARDESWLARLGRNTAMLFVTGLVIEIALMPIVLYHFHRAGPYGAGANVVAIPLVTLVSMPLIALGLVFDLINLGAPFWWLAGHSLDALLALAHFVSDQPGAVQLFPQIPLKTLLLLVAGGLWLALWSGRKRMAGLVPIVIGVAALSTTDYPDLLVTRDGRHVGIITEDRHLISLREPRPSYAHDAVLELSGVAGHATYLPDWPMARCSDEFCVLTIRRGARQHLVLVTRNRVRVEERALAASCERVDIVIADRYLPRSCRPKWLKADRSMLDHTGGIAVQLDHRRITTVAQGQGEHGWWRPAQRSRPPRTKQSATPIK